MIANYHTLRLILGDQLNPKHSWFAEIDDHVLYVLMELKQETDYAPHHIQKVVGFFKAMRLFETELSKQGHHTLYLSLNHPENSGNLGTNILYYVKKYNIQNFEYQLPDEYRLDQQLKNICAGVSIGSKAFDSEHFLTDRKFLGQFFKGKKTFLMESFYREMRRKYSLLMEADGKTPLTGRWNYDAENRKKMPPGQAIPDLPSFNRDVQDLVDMLENEKVQTIGEICADSFDWPLTRAECLEVLEDFLRNRLTLFGAYQDAMTTRDTLLFHSRLSFGLNTKMIHPLELVQSVEKYWQSHPEIELASVEGFIRQIIGWREYMRGIYWHTMPDYSKMNYFDHQQPLPEWYWNGKTNMKCLQHAISQSLEQAYAHHIQRLMVTGNFSLLLGVHPDEVDRWYLGIYMDAIEWVEITNTRGMSQFADGGIVGTKPYVATANYMHKMSDYCTQCTYDRKKKYGEDACPFNSLYWDFYDRHRNKLERNPRIGMMYRQWDKVSPEEKEKIISRANYCKKTVNAL